MYNSAQIAFKAIDVLLYRAQNSMKFQNVACIRNVAYKTAGGEATSGDIYFDKTLAARGRKFPVIVYIHGGGFVMGDKGYRRSIGEFFAHNGYFVYNINHRMPPDGAFREMAQDVLDGVSYVAELAQVYNLDLDKVIVSGDSSGGYLTSFVAAVAFNADYRAALELAPPRVRIAAIAPCCGIYDLNQLLQAWMPFDIIPNAAGMLFGMKIRRDLSNIRDFPYFDYASPVDFVTDDWCPAFILWSEQDLVCYLQADKMYENLRAHCPAVGKDHAPGLVNNHCYHLLFKNASAKQSMAALIRFLKEIGLN